jgi:hypothetical protein
MNKDQRRAMIRAELEAAGVDINELGSGVMKIYGAHGSQVMTNDLLNLRRQEIDRLCGDAV